jgi:hypothetical protein
MAHLDSKPCLDNSLQPTGKIKKNSEYMHHTHRMSSSFAGSRVDGLMRPDGFLKA